MNKPTVIVFFVILFFALSVRVYKINSPIADWHSWRQADTASVTRVFEQEGVDLLHPRFHDLSNIPSGKENPQGYRMVEFPLYNVFHYSLHKLFPLLSLEAAGRLTTVIGSLISLTFIFLITQKISGSKVGLIAAAVFAIMPYSIYYSRVILPDPWMVTMSLSSIYFFLRWVDSQSSKQVHFSWFFVYALISAIAALLIKPTAIFSLAVIAFIAFSKWKFQVFRLPYVYIFAIISVLPLLWWRGWIQQFPEGIPANSWLLNGDGIRFRPAWFRWLFYERINNLMLGGFGSVFLTLGLVKLLNSKEWLYLVWFALTVLYFAIFATGNVRHDYYQIPAIPIITILVAKGLYLFWTSPGFNRLLSIPVSIVIGGLAMFMSFYQVKGYYQINNPSIVTAGQRVAQLLPSNAKVIAPYQGDTAFLYQTNRSGWPLMTNPDIQHMIDLGATHYVSVNYDDQTKQLQQQFVVIESTDQYIIIDLTKPNTRS